jgi:hypothetical protein
MQSVNRMFAIFAQGALARRTVRRAFEDAAGYPMSTLRQIHGRIGVISVHRGAQWGISIILGAYLSLQLVMPGGLVG